MTMENIQLTHMETNVLRHVAKGLKDREIASQVFLSVWSVKKYISSLLQKCDCSNRTQLTAYAYQNNLLNGRS
jgi:DNA-binding NarL/FixJ family response regulator